MTPDVQLLVRYYEIALKGNNRRTFTRRLASNLERVLGDLCDGPVRSVPGLLSVRLRDGQAWPEVSSRVARLYGVANYSLSVGVPADLEAVRAAIVDGWSLAGAAGSFRVRCRRSDKTFPVRSPDVEREIGAFVHERWGLPVTLKRPELVIWIEVLQGRILVSFGKLPGLNGLPTGVSGEVVALLSGGIDSPVAAARLMKRGAAVRFVHFSGQPFQDRTSERKAREIVETLVLSQGEASLHHVPFGEVQRRVVIGAPGPLRVVLYRRLMLRIAEAIAVRMGALALATGESLGQVASQTLQNINVIDEAARLPVLRPLIGMDKDEIVAQARVLGTYDTSIRPDKDCCQLFVPPHSTLRARLEEVLDAESKLNLAELMQLALTAETVETFSFPSANPAQ